MEWNDLLKDVSARFKYRSWLLIDLPRDRLPLNCPIPNLSSNCEATLILDCGLEDIFPIIDALGLGVSYAASLQATRRRIEALVAAPPEAMAFHDFRWAC
ncbi:MULTISPECIES: hypothetical protein [Pseudomonas]|jgi:hypothetical protein|uniref:Uncharacterized protein n=3 Tax=Pseudomonas TaxID=286 RepID=A0A5M9J108_9PSED|nr:MULTISPECIES: hypothetical protein [Pseudomonas]KAA6165577.1 hypothetical protein F3K54_32825 [Pseudomonas veronii]KAA6171230.1 hypothetical protein F3K53_26835 [Pseudomonas veronii]KAA8561849.1 hypothetical protein FX985_01915 [Pseudomonas extremaustralis]MBZ6455795.1 hypothetical protein [Pseudomonas fluorescens group sp.]MBZ6465229.1 hypothetical protein [Pseudomonas fluorescens group sp.]